jgi:hypothetical protein
MPPAGNPGKGVVGGLTRRTAWNLPGLGALTLPHSPRKVAAMADQDHEGPRLSRRGQDEHVARQARQAQALRENLRKRAAQRRGRDGREMEPDPPAPGAGGDPSDGGDA